MSISKIFSLKPAIQKEIKFFELYVNYYLQFSKKVIKYSLNYIQSIKLLLEQMFNYYIVPNNLAYSLHPLQNQVMRLNNSAKAQSVEKDQYLALSKKYQQLKEKYENLKQQNQNYKDYIYELEDTFKPQGKKKKIKRRTESELSKQHACPYQSCKKQYASTLALNLHIRNKHEGGTKKERNAFIKQIIQAQQNGLPRPKTIINFCPELIEIELRNYKQKLDQSLSSNRKEHHQRDDSEENVQN